MSEIAVVPANGTKTAIAKPARRAVQPAVDILENADEVLLVADVPGFEAAAIDVRVENDTLTLEAKHPSGPGDTPALAREYEETDFARSFRIPAGIDAAGIKAEVRKGTVVVRLTKAAAAKPRKIAVISASGS
jgi:HSP20 family molecular chaperone IbpA